MNFGEAARIGAGTRADEHSCSPVFRAGTPETVRFVRGNEEVEVKFADWVAPDPVADGRLCRALAAEAYFEWLLARRIERACLAAKRATLEHRPKGTGKAYWAWVGRREAAASADPRVARIAAAAGAAGGVASGLSGDFLFSSMKCYLADRYAGIRARAKERFVAKRSRRLGREAVGAVEMRKG